MVNYIDLQPYSPILKPAAPLDAMTPKLLSAFSVVVNAARGNFCLLALRKAPSPTGTFKVPVPFPFPALEALMAAWSFSLAPVIFYLALNLCRMPQIAHLQHPSLELSITTIHL